MKKPVVHYLSDGPHYNSACGIDLVTHLLLASNGGWRGVTCKNCLKHKPTKRRKK